MQHAPNVGLWKIKIWVNGLLLILFSVFFAGCTQAKITATATMLPVLPTPIPTTTGGLPDGPKLVYSDTDGAAGVTTLWLTNITLNTRKKLLIATHKAGYGAPAEVSPDGKMIAYLVIPPEISEKGARTWGGTLWVMNSDGTNPHPVAKESQGYFFWSSDSTRIAYFHYIELDTPRDPQVPLGLEIYSVSADGTGEKLLISDDTNYGIDPLGWAPNGIFYYITIPLHGQRKIWKVDADTGQTTMISDEPSSFKQIHLSPDGTQLLVSGSVRPDQYGLSILYL
jgi:Tol biopolymer transport system component